MVVVGGGIHGVGIAQAAAADGHSVLVIEQKTLGDFCRPELLRNSRPPKIISAIQENPSLRVG